MNELDMVAALRPEVAPTTQTVDEHRARLRAAIDDANHASERGRRVARNDGLSLEPAVLDLTAEQPGRSGGRWPTRVVTVAASVVVLVAMSALALRQGTASDSGATASIPAASDATPSEIEDPTSPGAQSRASACGSELPIAIDVPDGYAGPTDGPSGVASGAPAADQIVRHWTAATGTVELRWPSREHAGEVLDDFSVSDGTSGLDPSDDGLLSASSIVGEPEPLPDGQTAVSFAIVSDLLGDDACRALELTVADGDAAHASVVASELHSGLFAPGGPFGGPVVPLVSGSTAAESPPEIPPCQAPTGVPHSDYAGGPVTGIGWYPAPAAALQAFIATKTTTMTDPFGIEVPHTLIAAGGYTETALPDGSVAYVRAEGEGVTVVHAVAANGAWTIDRWEATGC